MGYFSHTQIIIIISSRELSPFRERASCAAKQELFCIVRDANVNNRVHNSPQLPLIMDQTIQIPTITDHVKCILILFAHIHLHVSSGCFNSDFNANNPYIFLFSLTHSTCFAHLILLDLTILITVSKSTSYETLHDEYFFNLLSLHVSSLEIFSSAS